MNKEQIEEQIKRCSEISERFGENSDDFCGYPCVENNMDYFVKNEVLSGCDNCWFCINGQCQYATKCGGSKKWSNTLNSFVPITYQERKDLEVEE